MENRDTHRPSSFLTLPMGEVYYSLDTEERCILAVFCQSTAGVFQEIVCLRSIVLTPSSERCEIQLVSKEDVGNVSISQSVVVQDQEPSQRWMTLSKKILSVHMFLQITRQKVKSVPAESHD